MSRPLTISRNKHGQPRVTLVVEGDHEIFRWAYYHGHGPVEHVPEAMRIFRYLRRKWGTKLFIEHDQRVTGGHVVRLGWHLKEKHDV